MLKRLYLLSALTFLTSACATIGGRDQLVAVTDKPGAKIKYKNAYVGTTPAIVAIKRENHAELKLEETTTPTTIDYRGEIRWSRTGLGNLLFFTLAPVGWLTDYLSGAIYDMQRITPLPQLSTTAESQKMVIAIAPPQSVHPDLTDEVGAKLESLLQARYPKATILHYYDTYGLFTDEDVDYDEGFDPESELSVYNRLKVRHIFFSSISSSGDQFIVRGELNDVFDKSKNTHQEFAVSPKEVVTISNSGWVSSDKKLFYWAPNTIGLDFSDTDSDITVDGVPVRGRSSNSDDFWGKTSRYLALINIRRINPPSHRTQWSFRTYFSPTASFSHVNEEFNSVPDLEGYEFTRTHADLGYGPSFTFGTGSSQFYFNFIPTMAYDRIVPDNGGGAATTTRLQFQSEIGYLFFLGPHFNFRLFARAIGVDDNIWEEAFRKAARRSFNVEDSNLSTTGISIGYTFPNDWLKFFKIFE